MCDICDYFVKEYWYTHEFGLAHKLAVSTSHVGFDYTGQVKHVLVKVASLVNQLVAESGTTRLSL